MSQSADTPDEDVEVVEVTDAQLPLLKFEEEDAPELTAATPEPEPEQRTAPTFPLADAGEYYIGLWCGFPNYGCPYCAYKTLSRPNQDGNGLVELHILGMIDRNDKAHQAALEV